MLPLNDYYQFDIGAHFPAAIFNDDYSGLNDDEANELRDFLAQDTVYGATPELMDDEAWFGRCEVTGLHGTVVRVRFHFHNPRAAALAAI
jgi:hypothetical protein